MPNTENRGGAHAQHAKAGQQSHKSDDSRKGMMDADSNPRGGAHEQHAKPAQQDHKHTR